MHYRRIAAFLIGAWILGSGFLALIATQNTDIAERVLQLTPPDVIKSTEATGRDAVQSILRFEAAEQNRSYLSLWELCQILIGVLMLGALTLSSQVNRIALIVGSSMVMVVCFMHFALTPEMRYLGRLQAFTPVANGHTRYLLLKALYTGLEGFKLLLGCGIAGYLFVFKPKPRRAPNDEPSPIVVKGLAS